MTWTSIPTSQARPRSPSGYINNRTYLQIEQGGEAGAQATINLDVGHGVKLKAGAGTEGGTAGIFYEREY